MASESGYRPSASRPESVICQPPVLVIHPTVAMSPECQRSAFSHRTWRPRSSVPDSYSVNSPIRWPTRLTASAGGNGCPASRSTSKQLRTSRPFRTLSAMRGSRSSTDSYPDGILSQSPRLVTGGTYYQSGHRVGSEIG